MRNLWLKTDMCRRTLKDSRKQERKETESRSTLKEESSSTTSHPLKDSTLSTRVISRILDSVIKTGLHYLDSHLSSLGKTVTEPPSTLIDQLLARSSMALTLRIRVRLEHSTLLLPHQLVKRKVTATTTPQPPISTNILRRSFSTIIKLFNKICRRYIINSSSHQTTLALISFLNKLIKAYQNPNSNNQRKMNSLCSL